MGDTFMSDPVRLQKWLAQAGLCSRREGERWIVGGRVHINGKLVTELGTRVEKKDTVTVDGSTVRKASHTRVILALYKPIGVLVTRKDPENRPTVYNLLGTTQTRLINIGRLDYNSEGLILFTNDGNLANELMHPRNQVPRTYRVRVHGRVNDTLLEKLKLGVELEDGHTGPLDIRVDHVPGANSWLTITLSEGRNRIVRRIFEAMDMQVSRLIRIAFGDVTLGDLLPEQWRPLQGTETSRLLSFISNTDDPSKRPPPHPGQIRGRAAPSESRSSRRSRPVSDRDGQRSERPSSNRDGQRSERPSSNQQKRTTSQRRNKT